MENKITKIELFTSGEMWTFILYIDYYRVPPIEHSYLTPEIALNAAKEYAAAYLPPPPGKSWEDNLKELKIKLGL